MADEKPGSEIVYDPNAPPSSRITRRKTGYDQASVESAKARDENRDLLTTYAKNEASKKKKPMPKQSDYATTAEWSKALRAWREEATTAPAAEKQERALASPPPSRR